MYYRIIIFIISVASLFFIFDINPLSFIKKLSKLKVKKKDKEHTVKSYIKKVSGKTRENIISKSLKESEKVFKVIGQEKKYKLMKRVSLLIGIAAGALSLAMLRLPVLSILVAFGCGLIPLWMTKLSLYKHIEYMNSELETILSLITVSYERLGNIAEAVKENIDNAGYPLDKVLDSFLYTLQYIEFDIPKAIVQMKKSVDNALFHEWCDVLILCQDDFSLVAGLSPIIAKLSNIKRQQEENKTLMMKPLTDTRQMVILVLSIIPILAAVNGDWYNYLVKTNLGQIALCVTVIGVFMTIHKAIQLVKPIEYQL